MGFSLAGLAKAIFTTVTAVVRAVSGNPKPTIEMILPKAAGELFNSIMEASKYQDLTSKEKIDSWLDSLDKTFGSEADAIDVIHSMPAAAEEELTDGLLQAARAILYNKAHVPGYWVEAA